MKKKHLFIYPSILFSISTLSLSVLSCGSSNDFATTNYDTPEVNEFFSQYYQAFQNVNSTNLSFENFPSGNLQSNTTLQNLDLIIPGGLPEPTFLIPNADDRIDTQFYVLSKDEITMSASVFLFVTVAPLIYGKEFRMGFRGPVFNIVNFETKLNLNDLPILSINPNDVILDSIQNKQQVDSSELDSLLNNLFLDQINRFATEITTSSYTITKKWTLTNGDSIPNTIDLTQNTFQFKATITSEPDDSGITGTSEVYITIPKLNQKDVSELPTAFVNLVAADFDAFSTPSDVSRTEMNDVLKSITLKQIQTLINPSTTLDDFWFFTFKEVVDESKKEFLNQSTDLTIQDTFITTSIIPKNRNPNLIKEKLLLNIKIPKLS